MTFSEESVGTLGYAEMQLLPEPLYSLGTDAIHMLCVKVRRLVHFRCPNVFSKVFNSLMYVHILFRALPLVEHFLAVKTVAFTNSHTKPTRAGLERRRRRSIIPTQPSLFLFR